MTRALIDATGTFGRLMAAPGPRLNEPEPVLIVKPTKPPLAVAVMLALTLTLFSAVRANCVLRDQVTASLTLMFPASPLEPAALCSSTLVVSSSADSAAPVMSPPEAATV